MIDYTALHLSAGSKWVKNQRAYVANCEDARILDVLLLREKGSIGRLEGYDYTEGTATLSFAKSPPGTITPFVLRARNLN